MLHIEADRRPSRGPAKLDRAALEFGGHEPDSIVDPPAVAKRQRLCEGRRPPTDRTCLSLPTATGGKHPLSPLSITPMSP